MRERGVTVLLVEQSIDVVAAVADTVYLMRDGEIAAELAAAELGRDNPLVQESLLLEPPAGRPLTTGGGQSGDGRGAGEGAERGGGKSRARGRERHRQELLSNDR
jgi:energy-coupling factor transporter ATP-binding protein EcfA2